MKRVWQNFLYLFLILFSSCSLFETRTPEEPEGNNPNFPPPTTPQITMDNFLRSFNQKNIINYLSCFSDDSLQKFLFFPSPDAFSLYPNLFDFWDIKSEIDFAQNLFNKFSQESFPVLLFNNSNFSTFSPDSVLFATDYIAEINSKDNSINNSYKGTAHFVLKIDKNGLWRISRWFDFNLKNENFPSFSLLKAKLKS